MSNRRSSTNLLHPTTAFLLRRSRSFRCHDESAGKRRQTAWRIFVFVHFSPKKLSKMSRTRPRSPHCVNARAHGNAHVAFARGHGADAASEDAQERGRRERREPRGQRDPIAEGHLARREIARRRPEGAKLRVVQQRVAVRVLRRGRQGARGAGVPQVRLAFSRRAAESPLTRHRRRASAHPRRLKARAFPRPTRTAGSFSSASPVADLGPSAPRARGDNLVRRPERRTRRAARAHATDRSRLPRLLARLSALASAGAPRCTARAAVP